MPGPGYGTGAAAGDYDGDGFSDLYVTALGRNVLYRNRGDGTFDDVTEKAGVADPGYSASATFLDYDRDGDADLFVCHYLDWSPEREKVCLGFHGKRGYCSPSEYPPQASTLLRNEGNGRFSDRSDAAGIRAGRGRHGEGCGESLADGIGQGLPHRHVGAVLLGGRDLTVARPEDRRHLRTAQRLHAGIGDDRATGVGGRLARC